MGLQLKSFLEEAETKQMTKVSVIIPIYNCEQYLKQCIESILCQTLKDLEIICVDDGSTDQSVKIIQQFALSNKKVIFLQQNHQGPGIARNKGIKKATGKYVTFLDADDFYWDADSLERLWNACETKGVAAGASLQWCVNGKIERLECFTQNLKNQQILNYSDHQLDYYFTSYLILRNLLVEKEIYFPSYIRFEDPPFLVKVLYEAERFVVVDTCLYYYRRPVASSRFNAEKTCDLLHGLMDNLLFARERHLEMLFENTVQRLEFEYKHIFYKNLSSDGLRILKLLIQANQIICDQKKNPDYIAKPLLGLLKNMRQYENKIIKKVEAENEIVLYGAGQFAKLFFNYLEKKRLAEKVTAFVVSDLNGNESWIKSVPVITLQELKKEKFMFVTVRENIQEEVEGFLRENQYRNYELVDDDFFCMILQK